MYEPIIFKIEFENLNFNELNNINEKDDNLIECSNINLPLISLGFNDFMHRTKKSLTINKKKIHTKTNLECIINPFEINIPNYEDSINNLSLLYFNIKNEYLYITSKTFYSIWEILFIFNICDTSNLSISIISNDNSSIIQSIINYKNKNNININSDIIYNLSYENKISDEIINYYKKLISNITNDLFNTEKINSTSIIQGAKTSVIKNNSDLIIIDVELNWKDYKFKEQENYILLIKQIYYIFKTQNKNGNLIIKIYETFTLPTLKLIYILTRFYKESYIYRPFFSKNFESDKYIILKYFTYDQKILNNIIKSLENILNSINIDKYIYDIYPEFNIPLYFIKKFIYINKIAEQEQININNIIKYIKQDNYYGDKYHNYRNIQIESIKWWKQTFFPPSDNLLKKNKEDINNIINNIINKNELKINNFIKLLK